MTSNLDRRTVLAAGAAGFAALSGVPAMAATPDFPRLRALIDSAVSQGELAGITVAAKASRAPLGILSAGTVALDSHQPMGPHSICRIASMTKIVTGLCALMLVEEGKLGLDQPIAELAPEFASMEVANATGTEPAARPITVRHLLNFTAGIPHVWQQGPVPEMYRKAGLDGLGHHFVIPPGPGDLARPKTLKEYARRIAGLPLHSQPGVQWDYGFSMEVAGFLVEQVSGMTLDAVMRTRVFEPLGMADTGFHVPADKLDRLTTNYTRTDGKLVVWDDRKASKYTQADVMPSASAGLTSTAADYARFCQMLLNGGELEGRRIASPATVRAATSNLLPPEIERPVFVLDGADWGAGVSVQTAASVKPGETTVGSYGWSGGTGGTVFWVDPMAGTFVVVMMQRMMGDPSDSFHHDLAKAVMLDFDALG